MKTIQMTQALRRALPRTASPAAVAVLAAGLLAGSSPVAPAGAQTPGCQFVLGFERLHTLIPQVVGDCLWNEMHLANGDGTQVTTNGLLTWRKATNLTAFTNGEDIYVAEAAGVRAVVAGPAAHLRTTLADLLSEHAYLAVVAMQKGYDGAPDFDAAAKQLDANSIALSQAIASVYGQAAGDAFLAQWRDHIRMFVDFTVATAKHDEAGRQKALQELAQYRQRFAGFLASANPKLQTDAVAGALQEHVNQLVAALDSYAARDYSKVYEQVSISHAHMFMTGTVLATAIAQQFPERFPGNPQAQAADLQVMLDRLLSEHADLAVLAMQKGFSGAPDFQAVASQLDKNSLALADAVGSVYGPAARDAFLTQWRDHIRMFVDFTVATAKGDMAAREKALRELAGYKESFARFLNLANPNLPQDNVAAALQQHVDQLVGALNAYVAKDYSTTYDTISHSHHHMIETGRALAGGIVKQFPEHFV